MAYTRKTRDELEIRGNYGFGYECVNTETTWKDARRSIKEYRENEPGTPFIIETVRIPLTLDKPARKALNDALKNNNSFFYSDVQTVLALAELYKLSPTCSNDTEAVEKAIQSLLDKVNLIIV